MLLVDSIDNLVKWLAENVCSQIQLKLPDDYRNDTDYDVEFVNPAAFPLIHSGEGQAAAECTGSDPFGMRSAYGGERRPHKAAASAPVSALPCLLEPRRTWRGNILPSPKQCSTRRVFLLPRHGGRLQRHTPVT